MEFINILRMLLAIIAIFILIALIYLLTAGINRQKKIRKILRNIYRFRNKNLENEKGNTVTLLEREIDSWGEERIQEQERLAMLEKYRREYLGNISHELKTPVFNVQGYIHTLLDGGLEDKTINRSYLERAAGSVERIINIIEDLETISQLESGELKLEQESFDVISLIKEVFETEKMRAAAKNISLSFAKEDMSPAMVFADRYRIQQVLTNLVDNSIKYGKQNGETRVKVNDIGNKISVEVADNGIGISPEHLPRIFERFYRVDKSRSREQGGTGLGLAIVKHILEAHREEINVMSTAGAGTVFSFGLQPFERREIKTPSA